MTDLINLDNESENEEFSSDVLPDRAEQLTLSVQNRRFITDFSQVVSNMCDEIVTNADISTQDLQDFGRYVRALRTTANLTRQCLADLVELSKAQIVALENGLLPADQINNTLLHKLSDILAIEIDEFYLTLGRYSPSSPSNNNATPPPTLTSSRPAALRNSEFNAHQLAMLHATNTKMSQAYSLENMLQTALEEALQVIDADAGVIYMLRPTLDNVTLDAQWPEDDPNVSKSIEIWRSVEHVIKSGVVYHCPDIFEEAPINASVDDETFCSLLCIPIKSRHRVFGTIVAVSTFSYYFTISDEQFLSALADQIAVEVMAQMLKNIGIVVGQFDQKATLIQIVQTACYLMGTQSGAVSLIDPETQIPLPHAVKFPGDEFNPRPDGLSYSVANSCQPHITFDAQTDPRVKHSTRKRGVQSILAMPIEIHPKRSNAGQSQIIGVIFINSMSKREFDNQDIALLQSLAGQAAMAIERTRLYEKSIQERNQLSYLVSRLTAVHEATQQITSDKDIFALLTLIAREAAEILNSDAAEILLRDQKNDQQLYCGCYNLHCQLLDGACNQVGRQIHEQVIINGEAIFYNYLPSRADYKDSIYFKESIKALVSVPLGVDGKIAGMLSVYSRQQHVFTHEDERVLTLLAAQLSIALKNALLTRRSYRNTRALTAWNHGALQLTGHDKLPELVQLTLTQAVKLLKAAGGRLYLVGELERNFTLIAATEKLEEFIGLTLPVADSVIGQVIKTRSPVRVCNYRNWEHRIRDYDPHNFSAVVGVPIICWGRVWGAISIHDQCKDRKFTNEELKLLTHFGNLAAVMLENAEQVSGKTDKLTRLKKVTQASCEIMGNAEAISCEERLKFIALHIIKILNADNCEILLFHKDINEIFQGTFSKRKGGRVNSIFVTLPLDHLRHEITSVAPYQNRWFSIPWQTDSSTPPDWRLESLPRRLPWLKVPLIKRKRNSIKIIGLIRVIYSNAAGPKSNLEFGEGFTPEDEWILRIFADAVAVVIDKDVNSDDITDPPKILQQDNYDSTTATSKSLSKRDDRRMTFVF